MLTYLLIDDDIQLVLEFKKQFPKMVVQSFLEILEGFFVTTCINVKNLQKVFLKILRNIVH